MSKLKFGLYRSNPCVTGGSFKPVMRNGKIISFKNKKEGEDWLRKNQTQLVSSVYGTKFEIRKLIKDNF